MLESFLANHSPQAQLFIRPALEASVERQAKHNHSILVTMTEVEHVIKTSLAGVEWHQDALARVESAPDFIRAGIKKAAEFAARREGLALISSEDLTRFRNRAMMKAVRRMKGFGLQELNFDAFEIARERVPRLKENPQAAQRFSEIREYVETRQSPEGAGLGLLDQELMDRMRAELKRS